jgi:DNA-binding NarL/FixJ family response regulator
MLRYDAAEVATQAEEIPAALGAVSLANAVHIVFTNKIFEVVKPGMLWKPFSPQQLLVVTAKANGYSDADIAHKFDIHLSAIKRTIRAAGQRFRMPDEVGLTLVAHHTQSI